MGWGMLGRRKGNVSTEILVWNTFVLMFYVMFLYVSITPEEIIRKTKVKHSSEIVLLKYFVLTFFLMFVFLTCFSINNAKKKQYETKIKYHLKYLYLVFLTQALKRIRKNYGYIISKQQHANVRSNWPRA